MTRRSRSLGALGVVLALALAGVVVGAGGAGAQSAASDCGTTEYRVLFWPKGHGAIPSVGFPAFPTPHAELYTGTGKAYPSDGTVGAIDATGTAKLSSTCTPATPSTTKPGGKNKSTKKAVTLTCRFKADPVIIAGVVNGGGGGALLSLADGASTATAITQTTGSTLSYATSVCKASKPPH